MNLSDAALELLDGMVGMNLTNASFAASATAITNALDVGDLDHLRSCLLQLMDRDLVRKRPPSSIRDVTGYYVNIDAFDRLLRELDPDAQGETTQKETDWHKVAEGIRQLDLTVESSDLSQSERAQAGAIVASLKILIEAPEPPKRAIKSLLYEIAAIATVLAFAAQIAGLIF